MKNPRVKSTLIGALLAVLMLAGLTVGQVATAPTAEAAGRCTIQRYTTGLGARHVHRVKCPSTVQPYRAVVECEFMWDVRKRYGTWRWNNAWSTATCNFPYRYKRGWFQWWRLP